MALVKSELTAGCRRAACGSEHRNGTCAGGASGDDSSLIGGGIAEPTRPPSGGGRAAERPPEPGAHASPVDAAGCVPPTGESESAVARTGRGTAQPCVRKETAALLLTSGADDLTQLAAAEPVGAGPPVDWLGRRAARPAGDSG